MDRTEYEADIANRIAIAARIPHEQAAAIVAWGSHHVDDLIDYRQPVVVAWWIADEAGLPDRALSRLERQPLYAQPNPAR